MEGFSNIDALPMGKVMQPSQGGLSKLRSRGVPKRKKKSRITPQPAT